MDENPFKSPDDDSEPASPGQNKRPSPFWWLLILPIVDSAGILAARYGAGAIIFGAIFIFLLARWMLRSRP